MWCTTSRDSRHIGWVEIEYSQGVYLVFHASCGTNVLPPKLQILYTSFEEESGKEGRQLHPGCFALLYVWELSLSGGLCVWCILGTGIHCYWSVARARDKPTQQNLIASQAVTSCHVQSKNKAKKKTETLLNYFLQYPLRPETTKSPRQWNATCWVWPKKVSVETY